MNATTLETQERRFVGLLLGTAVGDALGLPAEGLSPMRIRKRWRGEWRMRLVMRRGLVSDDTEHAFFVAQSLLSSPADVAAFRRCLATRLRWWFLALPAGVGMATARACLKLCMGVSPERSGVFSAGNGPAMRSALLGVFFAADEHRRREYVAASTRLTHTDPRAEVAAQAVAEVAAWIARVEGPERGVIGKLEALSDAPEWLELCVRMKEALRTGLSVTQFADSLGLGNGVSGYSFHTVPVAIYAWLRHPGDFRAALVAALDCGGDTDTVGAIVGALAGCSVGESGIPPEWLGAIAEWPRTTRLLRMTAGQLSRSHLQHQRLPPPPYFWPGVLPRNMLFLFIVLGHGFRHLWPPY